MSSPDAPMLNALYANLLARGNGRGPLAAKTVRYVLPFLDRHLESSERPATASSSARLIATVILVARPPTEPMLLTTSTEGWY